MSHSFYAFIDESGDEGFTFRSPPGHASSEWFLISVALVSTDVLRTEMTELSRFIGTIYGGKRKKFHFNSVKHEQRAALSNYMAGRPFTAITVAWNKRAITEDSRPHALDQKSYLHRYSVRYLIERISWFVAEHPSNRTNQLPCKLIFSRCKNISYPTLKKYFRVLQQTQTEIRWPFIDMANILVRNHFDLMGLKLADALATGMRYGFELNQYQLTEPTHCRNFRPIAYKRGRKVLSYGLKIMPKVPRSSGGLHNRFGWIDDYK